MRLISIYFLIIYNCFGSAYSQVIIEGKVIDKKSWLPLALATVTIKNKAIGTTTDSQGRFSLFLDNIDLIDSISVSYLGYHTYSHSVYGFIETESNIIELKVRDFSISEVIIKPSKFDLDEFMKSVIYKYNNTRRRESHIALAHYREKALFNNRYVMFNESIGYSIYKGENIDASPISNYIFFYENTRQSSQDSNWKPLGPINQTRVPLSGSTPLNSFRWFEINGPLVLEVMNSFINFPKFNYRLDSTSLLNNQLVYHIRFFSTIFKSSNRMHGSMVITEDYKILEIKCSGPGVWSPLYHSRINGEMNFRLHYFEEQPYLSFAWTAYASGDYFHSSEINVLIQKYDSFALNEEEYWSINTYDYNPYIDYESGIWELYNIPDDNDIENINSDLNSVDGMDLNDQFKINSGTWYIEEPGNLEQLQKARTVIEKLKHLF